MPGGYIGKNLFVDISKNKIQSFDFSDDEKRKFIGGYGIGAKYIYENQNPNIDSLGEESIIGVLAGPLTGLRFPAVARFTVCGKSPLTNTWGDSNGSGAFGPKLKFSGIDSLFIKGKSDKPIYYIVDNGNLKVENASAIWGKDTYQTEDILKDIYGKKAEVLCIGPSGEKEMKLSALITSKGRAAARGGLAAIMGSKKIKAIVAVGESSVNVANEEDFKLTKIKFLKDIKEDCGFSYTYKNIGTTGTTVDGLIGGDSPVKNWFGSSSDMTEYSKLEYENMRKYIQARKGCFACPIACWGHIKIDEGKYKLDEYAHIPEYETCSAFGSYCLNNNFEVIIKCNDICNRYGIDTISTGSSLSFAINCFEEGLISKKDTDGIELRWGNSDAIVMMTENIAKGEGFGKILSNGVAEASKIIGIQSEKYAIHINGQELPAHDPRFQPSLAVIYSLDATPGRHMQGSCFCKPPGLEEYVHDLKFDFQRDEFTGRAKTLKVLSSLMHCIQTLGACAFGYFSTSIGTFIQCYNAATGWDISFDEFLETGERIGVARHLFNIREGLNPINYKFPEVILGVPLLDKGPLKGAKIDLKMMQKEYYNEMDWDIENGLPSKEKIKKLELNSFLDGRILESRKG